tara:strand:- start:10397 stop:10513 length:117 start_codon:yes stop_codon:yes gene_type:complete
MKVVTCEASFGDRLSPKPQTEKKVKMNLTPQVKGSFLK